MERLTLGELAAATGGTLTSPASRGVPFSGVGIDSRTVRPGEVFWAVPGTRHDGSEFVPHALARGAAAAVVGGSAGGDFGPLVRVADTTAALGRFANWYRSLLDAFVIGVTGSVGKTTTRELIYAALGGEPAAFRSPKNFNNQLGVPLTLLGIERRHRFAVVEMGAARLGEIAELTTIARPEAGVITHLGVAHVETFGGESSIVRGKGELVAGLPPHGFAVLPGDLPASRSVAARAACETISVGLRSDNDHCVRVTDCAAGRLRFAVDGSTFEITAHGSHFALLAGMAVVTARRLGRSDRQIAAGLDGFEPVRGRGRIAVRAPWTVVDDAYNANPDSMHAAVDALAGWSGAGRRVLVCGDMYGLGERTPAAHVELGRYAAKRQLDLIVAIGNNAGLVAQGARLAGMDARRLACFADRDEAGTWLLGEFRPGDVAWVKASRPLELEHLVDTLAEAASGRASTPLRAAA